MVLDLFSPAVREWFATSFPAPTLPQQQGWPAIAAGDHTLILAPTGSGKTLTAFLYALDRLTTEPPVEDRNRRKTTVQWRFTTDHARTKLDRLYPSLP